MTIEQIITDSLCQHGHVISEESVQVVNQFIDHLYDVNQVMNLTRISKEDAVTKHVGDSLLVSEFIADGSEVLDIGTGPGFPSFVLAACRSKIKVTAIDSSGKYVRFLKSHPLPNLNVLQQRVEEKIQREMYDVVTGRAVAPFSSQFELSMAWLKVGGLFVPFRTPSEEEEIQQSDLAQFGFELEEIRQIELPGTDIIRSFPLIRKVQKTSKDLPRVWAKIKNDPLLPSR